MDFVDFLMFHFVLVIVFGSFTVEFSYVVSVIHVPYTEPDLGMEPGLAHHFFLQLLNGVVSLRQF